MTDFAFRIRFTQTGGSSQLVEFEPGVHVIYGESGAGKSELCRRLVSPDSLHSTAGFLVENVTPVDRPMLVTQDPDDQIVAPSVSRELAFNLENLGWGPSEIERRVDEIVRQVRQLTGWDLDRHPSSLSGGERQMLNLATALSVGPDLLVIDDGLAFLSESNKQSFVRIFEEHCERHGAWVLWATSDPLDLGYGKQAWEFRSDSLSPETNSGGPAHFEGRVPPGSAVLKVDRLSFGYESAENFLFTDQNLTLGPFRSLAVLGDNGSGKTTLGRLLSGIVTPGEGNIGVELNGHNRVRLGFLPQFPERLFGGRTLSELLDQLVENGLFAESRITTLKERVGELGISWSRIGEESIHTLKVSEIRVAITFMICLAKYELIVLDEPLFGLGRTQRENMIRQLRAFLSAKHLVFITHSPSVARDVCDSAVSIVGGDIKEASLGDGGCR